MPPLAFTSPLSGPLPSAARPAWTCSATPRRAFLSRGAAAVAAAVLAAAPPRRADALVRKRVLAKARPEVALENGVAYRDINIGKGNSPNVGDTVAIHYSLFYDGLEVESSRESQGLAASPKGFTFGIESGPGSIMKGVNLGIEGSPATGDKMKVGGLRWISIPAKYAYGEKGRLPLIPPNADIEMAVSLLSCKRAGSNPNSMFSSGAQVY